MPKKEYPLAALAHLRAQKIEDAARELATLIAQREAATQSRVRAERAKALHDEAVEAARRAHLASLDRGELRAADLMRADAWEAEKRVERAELERRHRAASSAEIAAVEAEARAKKNVAEREADGEVVERHQERFDEAVRKGALAAEEEDADEAFLGHKRAR